MDEKEIDGAIMDRVRSLNDEIVKSWRHVADSWKQLDATIPEPVKLVRDKLIAVYKEYVSIISKETITDVDVARANDIIKMLNERYVDKMDENDAYRHPAVSGMISWILLTPVRGRKIIT